MSDGTRGGSTNAALDLIATDDLNSGSFSGQKAQIVKLGVGGDGNMEPVYSSNPLPVLITDGETALVITEGGALSVSQDGTSTVQGNQAEDAAVVANPLTVGGRASAAAPTNVSADGDVVNAWHLRNGAAATVLTAAGALIGGDAANGLDVDVTRLSALVAGSAIIGKVGIDQTTPGTTNAVSAVLTTGSAAIGKLAANDGVDVGDVTINNASGAAAVNVQDGGNSLTVDGSVTASIAAAQTLATVTTVGTVTTITNVVHVDDNSGSLTIDGTVTASNTAGDIAHDGVDSGNPVKVGAKGINAFPTAVSNGDRTNNVSDLFGRQMTTHIDPAMQVNKAFNASSTQTGISMWTPTSGKRIAVTSIVVGTYATTAARIIIWFGDSGDTTYSAGSDQLVLAFSSAPSATAKPGMVFTPAVPIFCTTADRQLHITTDAGISIDVAISGYEW